MRVYYLTDTVKEVIQILIKKEKSCLITFQYLLINQIWNFKLNNF